MVRAWTVDGSPRERRSIERRWLYRSALLSVPGQIAGQPCSLRDFTIKGAGIRLNGITLLPLTFELSLDGFRTAHKCRLVWRDGDFAGVIFLTPVNQDRAPSRFPVWSGRLFLNELQALNYLYLHEQAIDTTTPSGRAMSPVWRLRRV